MKRKLTFLCLGALCIIIAALVFSDRHRSRKATGTTQLFTNQDGRITLMPRDNGLFTVVAHFPKPTTNTPPATPAVKDH